ncbi:MAG: hypothetical protein DYG89_06205 [Caldilinea sp. CFX5]|nr:hypothetical protein [Caldilinea sp. CFX5]
MQSQLRATMFPVLPFLGGWVVANGIGGALGGLLEARLEFLGTLVLVGSMVGLTQWFFLRGKPVRAAPWAWAMAIGWLLGNLLRVNIGSVISPLAQELTLRGWFWEVFWLNFLQMPVTLAVIGLLQGLLLMPRRHTVPSWVLINVVGGAILGGVGATFCLHFCDRITAAAGVMTTGLLLGAVSWIGYAVVTGPVLLFLLRSQKVVAP